MVCWLTGLQVLTFYQVCKIHFMNLSNDEFMRIHNNSIIIHENYYSLLVEREVRSLKVLFLKCKV